VAALGWAACSRRAFHAWASRTAFTCRFDPIAESSGRSDWTVSSTASIQVGGRRMRLQDPENPLPAGLSPR
ncbi:hypothetical protein RB213_002254, partial [Colletotrichum asianum]